MINLKLNKTTIYILTSLGAIPFIFCALLIIFGVNQAFFIDDIRIALNIYGLVVLSFLAGAHWGMQLTINNNVSIYLAILSNIVAVSAWLSYLLFPIKFWLIVLAVGFLILLFIDYCLLQLKLIDVSYLKLRFIVTFLVCSLLILVWIMQ